jgi:hypothetical protein
MEGDAWGNGEGLGIRDTHLVCAATGPSSDTIRLFLTLRRYSAFPRENPFWRRGSPRGFSRVPGAAVVTPMPSPPSPPAGENPSWETGSSRRLSRVPGPRPSPAPEVRARPPYAPSCGTPASPLRRPSPVARLSPPSPPSPPAERRDLDAVLRRLRRPRRPRPRGLGDEGCAARPPRGGEGHLVHVPARPARPARPRLPGAVLAAHCVRLAVLAARRRV